MKSLPTLTALVVGLATVIGLASSFDLLPTGTADDDLSQTNSVKEDVPNPKGETAAAIPTQTAAAAQGESAVALLQEARRRLLYDRSSVRATLKETVNIGPRKFRAQGTYVAGRFPKLRLTMAVEVGRTQGQLLEVCDGTILWTVQEIGTGKEEPDLQVSRTVISDVVEAQGATTDVPETFLIVGLGVGGLPAHLASLERSMTFEAIRKLNESGRAFSVIQGRWSDEYLSRLRGGKEDTTLPPYMPDHVRIYFDDETKFPTRILYLRRTEPGSRTFTALLSLEFSDVVLDAPVSEEHFQYTPPSTVKVRDRTGEYLKMIDNAAKKARGDDPIPAGDQ